MPASTRIVSQSPGRGGSSSSGSTTKTVVPTGTNHASRVGSGPSNTKAMPRSLMLDNLTTATSPGCKSPDSVAAGNEGGGGGEHATPSPARTIGRKVVV